jgi:hypothetical protein
MTQMTQSQPATGASLQFKSMTQMTQMTQSHADILTWCMRRQLQHAVPWPGTAGRSAGWPLAIPTMLGGGWVGPAAQVPQKRTGRKQFFFLQNLTLFFKNFFLL